ncbi:DUF1254 domain-containing protein [Gammaproteobacteria bacterium]|nr:DUF1254 domain-containing protein [Gammaproteobacteria bacterium]
MSTDIPTNIITPDTMETSIGTLNFIDGVPTASTAQKVWDQLDFSRAMQAMVMATPAASLQGFRKGIRKLGPDNETMIYWNGRLDSKGLLLTGNTTVVYTFMWIDLKDGPMVMETPPSVLGILDDAWFKYVTDFGDAGEDAGKGGKYLLIPPNYEGDIPDGYLVRKSNTYGHWLAMRGFMEDFDPDPVVKNMKQHFRLYPLGSAPKEVNWINTAMQDINTLHAQDMTFYEEVNTTVQEEPSSAQSAELLGLLASIGIEKGKPFAPDDRMKAILSDAAKVGTAAQRAIIWRNRDESVAMWPGSQSWEVGFAGGNYAFEKDGVSKIDDRVRFHFYATGITPAMINPPIGTGSSYVIGLRDSQGRDLDGSKTYRIHVPPNIPAKRFWDITVYDNQTRSLLQTDNPYPGATSIDKTTVQNGDGSYDVYIGPEKPMGDVNWIQTDPSKGWNLLWRIYGPLQAWYDKTWRPSEIERVN